MKKFIITIIFAAALMPFWQADASIAEPSVVINEQTKECYPDFPTGDECATNTPPEGWKKLGGTGSVSCPEGYTVISMLKGVWTGFQNSFCCSDNHSGGAGDCGDLIINHQDKKCAFMLNRDYCTQEILLVEGWSQRENSELCPADYTWEEEKIDCSVFSEVKNGDVIAKLDLGNIKNLKDLQAVEQNITKRVDRYATQLFYTSIALVILFSILLIILIFYRSSRRR